TVIAAYKARHRRTSLAAATRKGRRLLGLAPGGAAGRALLGITPAFDGFSFLRAARAHGGPSRYAARLVARGRPVSFRGPRLLGGWDEYVKLITNAKDAISGVYSIGKTVYDIFNWVKGKEDREGQIWEAVQRMEKQLDAIQTSLDQMKAQIDEGFRRIENLIDIHAYNALVRPLKNLAGTVASTQDAFIDLINNAVSPDFSADYAAQKLAQINAEMPKIIEQFQRDNDVFRDSLLKGALFTTPTYSFAAKALLATSARFMTPDDSAQLQNFAGYMLQYQALAFNLIVRWETKPGVVSRTLANAIKLYLGFDSVDKAREWLEKEKPEVPATGDLHDELAYLDTIRPVPAHTIVDSFGTSELTGTGLMWSYEPLKAVRFDLRDPIHFPPGIYCGGSYQAVSGDWCPYMSDVWNALKRQLSDYEETFGKHVGLTGWEAPTPTLAQTALKRIVTIPDAGPRPYYWTPVDATTVDHGYQQLCDGRGGCQLCPENQHCGWYGRLIDGVSVPTLEASGNRVSCTIGVGDKDWRGTYFPDRAKRADCPLLAPIIERKPGADERYWPQLPAR
ncbi:MAG TPA: hypothetical protein VFW09_13505, partial [Solirubrobacteraceae bacterium]|nr:hypothetical protein [Solirubrobacteraceae bacterium]